MKNFGLLLIFTVLAVAAQSQTIKGKVVDPADDKPLAGATLTLTHVKDSLRKYNSISDATGAFQFNNLPKDSFFLKITFTTYEDYKQIVAINDSIPNLDLATVYVPKKTTEIGGVVVTANVPPVQQKGDTAQYNASQFKVNPDATTEDLIKKMPGITVGRDGSVTAQGQTVQKVTVDGRDFFGDDATATLRNLPAEIVDKIQVFDRMSDQAQFTGFDDGNTQRSINIVTKSGVTNGQFGRIYAGYGTDDRYAAGGNVSFFKGNRRVSFVGNFNNINQQNFASQDILGAMTGGGGGGRGGGGNFGGGGGGFMGGGGGNFGGGNNFSFGQQSGISKTSGLGINFGDRWGKKLDIQGSYFFNHSNNTNDQEQNRKTIFSNGVQTTSQQSLSATKNQNHRINMRLTYTIDSNNSLIITPNISFQNTKSATNSYNRTFFTPDGTANLDSANYSDVLNRSTREGYNVRNNILWRHAFAKRGRTLSVSLNTALNKNSSESNPQGYYRFYNNGSFIPPDSTQNQFTDNVTDGYTISGNISYTEPLTRKSQLQISYQPSFQKNRANQEAFDYDDITKGYTIFKPSLANKFDNTTITHNGGVTYRLGASRDNQLSIGADLRYTELNSDRTYPTVTAVRQSFLNVLPNVMWRKKISAKSSLQVFYRANTSTPSVTQLQDVLNLTNPTNVSIGNPNLKQSFTNIFTGRYTFTNTQKGQSFFANLSLQTMSDYISNVTYRISDTTINGEKLQPGSNLTVPVNINGYKSFASFFTYSQPVKFIKSNVNLSTGFNYSNLPGLVQRQGGSKDLQKTKTENFSYNAGIVVASNINEYIDFNLSYNATFNNAKSSITADNRSVNKSAAIQVNLLSKKGWFLQNDVSNQSLSGLADGFNQSFWLWNAAVGKKFLKKKQAELKLSVFDLLKQNQSISRSVSENVITDSRSVVLQQYFILTFTYSLRNFGTPARRTNGFDGQQRGNWNGPGGGAPGGMPPGGMPPGGFPGGGFPGGF